ncbi:protein phosphatase 2 (formerly 2A), regulatory subunit B'' [Angomonas deanei]|nr:protein phosphatase 2 (formerly 2A), regulatory subunit B'' [Angomonas deanei]|eukprot:EPY43344.1 protein phosphatase 2 (formerly 2A), regulatory subunit B'' [Angomonas deanei]
MEPLPSEAETLSDLLAKENGKPVKKAQFGDISWGVFKIPIWLKDMLFKVIATYVGAAATAESLTAAQITRFFKEVYSTLIPSRRLFELIRGNSKQDYISIEDLKVMAKHLVSSHPGLEFLQQPEFQEYYCRTVAIRIMYNLERQQCRRIYWRDFDRSDLPEVMMDLDTKDVNQVLEYFSYEHFYVLYCKFWELDTDRDLLVDYSDLCNYGQGSIVPSVIKRVVDGYGRPLTSGESGRLDFEDFVYFCLSEEDKNSDPAIYYWFRVLDVDSDGILSGYELAEFYKENQVRFSEFIDSPDNEIAYEDTMCQMLDMLGFERVQHRRFGVTLGDLRACPTPANFFNMIFNASKFLLFEHRDPFSEHQQKLRIEKTDWDRFARAEYDRMAAEAQ